MRRPSEFIYFVAGTLCLILSVFLVLQSDFSPLSLSNRIFFENTDRSYKDYYQSDLKLHKNSLRQAAVYLPMYSVTTDEDVQRFAESFGMDMDLAQHFDDYVLLANDTHLLRIYSFLDLIEYEKFSDSAPKDTPICCADAKEIARNFAKDNLYMHLPFELELSRCADAITVTLTESLGKIPNLAFPTTITFDTHGNIISAIHFYFEYEELARGDLSSPHFAMSKLPKLCQSGEKIRITQHKVAYVFADSILQPTHIFQGYYPDGNAFIYHVPAIRNYR